MRRKTVTTNLRYIVDWSAPIFTALPGLQDRRPRPDEASANPALRPWQRPGPPELTEDLHRFGAESKRFLDRSSLRDAAPSRVPGSGRGRPALPLPSVEPARCARIDNQPVAVPGGARLPSTPDLTERLQPGRGPLCGSATINLSRVLPPAAGARLLSNPHLAQRLRPGRYRTWHLSVLRGAEARFLGGARAAGRPAARQPPSGNPGVASDTGDLYGVSAGFPLCSSRRTDRFSPFTSEVLAVCTSSRTEREQCYSFSLGVRTVDETVIANTVAP